MNSLCSLPLCGTATAAIPETVIPDLLKVSIAEFIVVPVV